MESERWMFPVMSSKTKIQRKLGPNVSLKPFVYLYHQRGSIFFYIASLSRHILATTLYVTGNSQWVYNQRACIFLNVLCMFMLSRCLFLLFLVFHVLFYDAGNDSAVTFFIFFFAICGLIFSFNVRVRFFKNLPDKSFHFYLCSRISVIFCL